MTQWRLIETGVNNPQWNMAVDEALMSISDDTPVLRLYGWTPAISYGRFQTVQTDVDLNNVEEEGFSFVRRPTGGGILLHGSDISYAMVTPRTKECSVDLKATYRHLCSFLIGFYEMLGLHAGFASDLGLKSHSSRFCLLGTEPHDLVVKGHKIGGNAQRHTKRASLQHGTIPLSCVNSPLTGIEEGMNLEKLGISLTYSEANSMLIDAWQKSFGMGVVHDRLNAAEQALAEELYNEKYSTEEWNLHAGR